MRYSALLRSLCRPLTFIVLLFSGSITSGQENAELLFRSARYAETVQGDLARALDLYERILDQPETAADLAARSLLQMGGCYEKLGDPRAESIYKRIIRDYADQTQFAALARSRLSGLETGPASVHPLVHWYFQRTGIDPYVATSFDGTMQAYTDWNTGNLVVKDLSSGTVTYLTDTEWDRTQTYACHPAWSRDGECVAYMWYTGFFACELRCADLKTGETRVVLESPHSLIYPQDWSPDDTILLAETYDFRRNPPKRMALIDPNTGEREEFLSLDINARGFTFSPDGDRIAYDSMEGDHRHIYCFSRKTRQITRLTTGSHGIRGFDNPVWSPDGGRILFRSIRSSQYDLWTMGMEEPTPGNPMTLVQEDLTRALLVLKSIEHHHLQEPERPIPNSPDAPVLTAPFIDHFDADTLSAPWTVLQWSGPNVYGNASFGRWSLRERPGFLRYRLDPMMIPRHNAAYLPNFRAWYWYYPATEIGFFFSGTRWELETRVIYSFHDGTNSQDIALGILFDLEKSDGTVLEVRRLTNIKPVGGIEATLYDQTGTTASGAMRFTLPDTPQTGREPFIFRICRDGNRILVLSRNDDTPFEPLLEGVLSNSNRDQIQRLLINGECWFVPAGARADFDYMRFRPLEPGEQITTAARKE
ncbi:PD40 domain-containing protein [bacterium]|nr:PD40 domain-containing protein [bacterium]